jgi:hypothetical protein
MAVCAAPVPYLIEYCQLLCITSDAYSATSTWRMVVLVHDALVAYRFNRLEKSAAAMYGEDGNT